MAKEKDYSDLGFEEVAAPQEEQFEPMSDKLSRQLSAFSGGAQQGLTFGFADELSGLVGSGLDKGQAALNKLGLASPSPSQVDESLMAQGATGDLQTTRDIYNQFRDLKRKELEAQEQEFPMTALAGNIVGGGVGLAGTPLSALAPSLKGATALQGAGKLVASGGAGGALLGAGMSQAETLPELGQDVGEGALLGAAGSLTLGGAGQAISKAPSALAKLPIIRDAVEAAQGAAQGKVYTENVPGFQQELRNLGSDAVQTLKDLASQKFSNKTDTLKKATEAGVKSDISAELMQAADAIESLPGISKEQIKAKKELQKLLDKFVSEKEITRQSPQEMESFLKSIQPIIPQGEAAKLAPEAMQAGVSLRKGVKGRLEEVVPDLPKLNKESHDVQELMKRLTGVGPEEIRPGMDEAQVAAIKDRVGNILKKSKDSPAKLDDIIKGFEGVEGLQKYAPEKAKAIKASSEQINKDLRLAQLASDSPQNFEGGLVRGLLGNAQKIAVQTGEKIGKIAPKAVNKVATKSPEQMTMLSQKAVEKYGKDGEALANVLQNASSKPAQARTAVVFGLMQDPKHREKLNELENEDQDEDLGFEGE